MSDQFRDLSEEELEKVIESASKVLRDKQDNKRKEVVSKIRELASGIGVSVEFVELTKAPSRRGGRIPAKYKNPKDPSQTWTGRGMKPIWLRDLINQGHSLSEFEISA